MAQMAFWGETADTDGNVAVAGGKGGRRVLRGHCVSLVNRNVYPYLMNWNCQA